MTQSALESITEGPTMTQLVQLSFRVKEYENGNPYIMLEQRGLPGEAAAGLKPFAFDLRPGTTCEKLTVWSKRCA